MKVCRERIPLVLEVGNRARAQDLWEVFVVMPCAAANTRRRT